MAREGSIENPTKVTLYMPKNTVKRGKKYASETGSSLSQLVTNLVEKEVGDEIPVTVRLNRTWWEKASKKADANGMTLEHFVQKMLQGNEDSGD
mgnify:FL=1